VREPELILLLLSVAGSSGSKLTVQGEANTHLYVAINGSLSVSIEGRVAATLSSGQLVGEASLLEYAIRCIVYHLYHASLCLCSAHFCILHRVCNIYIYPSHILYLQLRTWPSGDRYLQSDGVNGYALSRATVTASPGTCYVRWPQAYFLELQQEEDNEFAYVFQLMIARTLSNKLKMARIQQQSDVSSSDGRAGVEAMQEVQTLRSKQLELQEQNSRLKRRLQASEDQARDLTSLMVSFSLLTGISIATFEGGLLDAFMLAN